jgi:hypothetical protein
MPERRKDNIPLTPELIRDRGGFVTFPSTRYRVGRNWTHTYDVWASRGVADDIIEPLGSIEIDRRMPDPSTKKFSLRVVQELVSDLDVVNHVSADMVCRQDHLASPVSWSITSEHSASGIPIVPDVSTEEKVRVEGDMLIINRSGKTFSRPAPEHFTGDWNLIEAVQRPDWGMKTVLKFDLLEGLTRFKSDMELRYDGEYTFELGGKPFTTHRYVLTGRGILPYEYFLDENHRVVLVITFCKAYILKECSSK